jgi:hypothetical protein
MFNIKSGIKEQTISAVIIRSDGKIEDLGIIARTKINFLRRVLKWLMS